VTACDVPKTAPVALLADPLSEVGLHLGSMNAEGERLMRAYNVFRTREIDFYCAVPEDRPVPAFVGSKGWEFRGRLDEGPTVKLPKSLRVSVRYNGFYIFHPFEKPKLLS
jgi:hypothetical protein